MVRLTARAVRDMKCARIGSHWISCTLSIARGGKSPSKWSRGMNFQLPCAACPAFGKKNTPLNAVLPEKSAPAGKAHAPSVIACSWVERERADFLAAAVWKHPAQALPAACLRIRQVGGQKPGYRLPQQRVKIPSPRLLLAYFTRRRARKSENRGARLFLRKPSRVLAKPAIAC